MPELLSKADLIPQAAKPVQAMTQMLSGTGAPQQPKEVGILDILSQVNEGLKTLNEISKNIAAVKQSTGQGTEQGVQVVKSAAAPITTEGAAMENKGVPGTEIVIDTDRLIADLEQMLPLVGLALSQYPEIANTPLKDLPAVYQQRREQIVPLLRKNIDEKMKNYVIMRPVA